MTTNEDRVIVIGCVIGLVILALFEKRCQQKQLSKTASIAGIPAEDIKDGWGPTVIIIPTSDRYDNRILPPSDGRTIPAPLQTAVGSTGTNSGSATATGTTGASNGILRLSDLPTRPDNIVWNVGNGSIKYSWYGLSFAPGINIQTDGKNRGLGLDIRGLYVNDFGLQIGAAYYQNEKVRPQISLGYNLRRTKILSNCDLIIGLDTQKNLFGGIRAELGQYWRN